MTERATGHVPDGPRGTGCTARIEEEHGRFVLYLDFWMVESDADTPTGATTRRISDHPTRRAAELAGDLIVRAATRSSS